MKVAASLRLVPRAAPSRGIQSRQQQQNLGRHGVHLVSRTGGDEAAVGLVPDDHLDTMETVDAIAEIYRGTDLCELETVMPTIDSRFATIGTTVATERVTAAAVGLLYGATIETETAAVIGIVIGIIVTAGMIGTQVGIDIIGTAAATVITPEIQIGIGVGTVTEIETERTAAAAVTTRAPGPVHGLDRMAAIAGGHGRGLNLALAPDEAIAIDRTLAPRGGDPVPDDGRGRPASWRSTAMCLRPATAVDRRVVASALRAGIETIGHGLSRSIGMFLGGETETEIEIGTGTGTGIVSAAVLALALALALALVLVLVPGLGLGLAIVTVTVTEKGKRKENGTRTKSEIETGTETLTGRDTESGAGRETVTVTGTETGTETETGIKREKTGSKKRTIREAVTTTAGAGVEVGDDFLKKKSCQLTRFCLSVCQK